MKHPFKITAVLLACLVIAGCSKEKGNTGVDLSGIHSSESVQETMSQTTAAVTTEAPSAAPETTKADDAYSVSNVSAKLNTYTSGKISIEYPSVAKMEDTAKESQVNSLLKENALSFLTANSLDDTTTVNIKCKVISVDREKLTAVYTGSYTGKDAAYPVNVFFTNCIDLKKCTSISLKDHADPYTMAGYILSNDVVFYGASAELTRQLMEYRSTLDINQLTTILTAADFPVAEGAAFPESFSYDKQGEIYFSIPVIHALGDYAIIKFSPETK